LRGKAHRSGLFQCNDCREQFTVTTGSVMERPKIPLNQSAWFLAHRIREAMKETTTTHGPLGGEGKVIEADELYYGMRETPRPRLNQPASS
jgi:hypothetical protein